MSSDAEGNGRKPSKEELSRRAEAAGLSLKDYLAKLVQDYLDHPGSEKPPEEPPPPDEPPSTGISP